MSTGSIFFQNRKYTFKEGPCCTPKMERILLLHIYKICIVLSGVVLFPNSLITRKIWLKRNPQSAAFKKWSTGDSSLLTYTIYTDFFFSFYKPSSLIFFKAKVGRASKCSFGPAALYQFPNARKFYRGQRLKSAL